MSLSLPRARTPLSVVFARALLRRRAQSAMTVLGIAVGVMALIVALSLTNGFSSALIQATLRATPELSLFSLQRGPANPALQGALAADPRVQAHAPFLSEKVLLLRPAREGGDPGVDFATVYGVRPDHAGVLNLRAEEAAALRGLQGGEVLLGSALAASLGVYPGERLAALNAEQEQLRLQHGGSFATGNYLIDSAFAFAPLSDLQRLAGAPVIDGYQLRLQDPGLAPAVGREYAQQFGLYAVPWQDLNATLLEQLALQKRVIGLVVFLIVIVAAFGIANVLLLTVFEKSGDIAILRAIGAGTGDIVRAFLWQGLVLGALGLLLGSALGLGVSAYLSARPLALPGDLYFISALPVEVRAADVLWVNLAGLITTLLAALIPARRAAGIEPGRLLR